MLKSALDIFLKYKSQFLSGTLTTILLSFVGTIIGFLIGLILGIIRTIPYSKNSIVKGLQKAIRFIIALYVEVFRGTPMIVQSMVIYWGYAFMHNGETLNLILAGIIIVSINTGAYLTEIVRGGIDSIDKGQYEGAIAIGMSHSQAMYHVVMPQVVKNILAGVSNEFINNIKDTSVLNVIGVAELYFATGKIIRVNFEIFETYIVTCIIYLIITFSISRLLRYFEKKLEGDLNYQIVNTQSFIPGQKEGM